MEDEDKARDKLLRALGLISINFQGLEYQLRWFVALMMVKAAKAKDTNEQAFQTDLAFTITSELPFSKLLAMFASLYKHIEGNRLSELTTLLKRASDAVDDRNRMVHSHWGGAVKNSGPIQMRTTAKQERNKPSNLRLQFNRMPLRELEAIADALWEVDKDIRAFMLRRGYSFNQ